MSRATLLRRVWRGDVLEGSRTIDVHIRWLRAKVERDPERPIHLLTVRGVGYQLELETEAAGLNESLTDRQRTVDAL
jgi:DNA-binding response OmpR family regulator